VNVVRHTRLSRLRRCRDTTESGERRGRVGGAGRRRKGEHEETGRRPNDMTLSARNRSKKAERAEAKTATPVRIVHTHHAIIQSTCMHACRDGEWILATSYWLLAGRPEEIISCDPACFCSSNPSVESLFRSDSWFLDVSPFPWAANNVQRTCL
jgi:hypothetical protein